LTSRSLMPLSASGVVV